MSTAIAPARLVELRAEARAKGNAPFVDPTVCYRAVRVLQARGERWAEAVCGRRFDRRSMAQPAYPWLENGEEHLLVAADAEEDRARFAAITDEMES